MLLSGPWALRASAPRHSGKVPRDLRLQGVPRGDLKLSFMLLVYHDHQLSVSQLGKYILETSTCRKHNAQRVCLSSTTAVFQQGIFLRVLCLPLLSYALPEIPCAMPDLQCPARLKNKTIFLFTYNCCFCVFKQPMNCKLLADLCPCFHRSPTKLCRDLVVFSCGIVPEIWSFAL